jgi:hypothetical protein
LQKIADVIQQGLAWTQPRLSRMEYELRAGDVPVATLAFPKQFGTLAQAQSGDGAWTFKRIGFWQQKASIRLPGAETDLALFTNHTGAAAERWSSPTAAASSSPPTSG